MLARHVRELASLQHAELARRVAGRAGAEVTRLHHHDLLTGAGQQQGRGQPGDAGADHDDVGGPHRGDLVGTRRSFCAAVGPQ